MEIFRDLFGADFACGHGPSESPVGFRVLSPFAQCTPVLAVTDGAGAGWPETNIALKKSRKSRRRGAIPVNSNMHRVRRGAPTTTSAIQSALPRCAPQL
jgi:hypothetical protein